MIIDSRNALCFPTMNSNGWIGTNPSRFRKVGAMAAGASNMYVKPNVVR
jgi:hypothetical protein